MPFLPTRLLVSSLLLVAAVSAAQSQYFRLSDVDARNYPLVSARYTAVDAVGNPLLSLSASNFQVLENGRPVKQVIATNCPPIDDDSLANVLLVGDRSGSMEGDKLRRMKQGLTTFINNYPFAAGGSVGLTAFNLNPLLYSPFRTTAQPLRTAVNSIQAFGGTNVTNAFLNPIAGGIPLLSQLQSPRRRVLVMVTDALPSDVLPHQADSIIAAANAERVEIHMVILGVPASLEIQRICKETGGQFYDLITSDDQMTAVMQTISLWTRSFSPCTLQWLSQQECGDTAQTITAAVTLRPLQLTEGTSYLSAPTLSAKLVFTQSTFWFGDVPPGDSSDLNVTITAVNDSITLTGTTISAGEPFSVADWRGAPPPFVLQPGQRRVLRLRFSPLDRHYHSARLTFATLPCPSNPLYLLAGPVTAFGTEGLKLVSPTGAEVLTGCDSVLIEWTGVSPVTPIVISYSGSDGVWRNITTTTGLRYFWRPPMQGKFRVKVSTVATERSTITTVAGGGSTVGNAFAKLLLLNGPNGLSLQGDSLLFVAEAGGNQIRKINLQTGFSTIVAGKGTRGFSGDAGQALAATLNYPRYALAIGQNIFIADNGNSRIRLIESGTGIIRTIAGTGTPGRTGDEGKAIAARLTTPEAMAVGLWGTSPEPILFFSDGSQSIRAVNTATGIITTVAGLVEQGDSLSARSTRLLAPMGLDLEGQQLYVAEYYGHIIRRIDLRTGKISHVAGTFDGKIGSPGFSGDGGPATSAQLYHPTGVAVSGRYAYITDGFNHRIRRVDMVTGTITTIAGTGTAGFGGDDRSPLLAELNLPTSPLIVGNRLYFCDVNNHRIRVIDLAIDAQSDSSQAFTVERLRLAILPGTNNRTLQLGTWASGLRHDTTIAGALCNPGALSVSVTSATISGPDRLSFNIITPPTGNAIPPQQCLPLSISFVPQRVGPLNATLVIAGTCGAADTIQLRGTGAEPCGFAAIQILEFPDRQTGIAPMDTVIESSICNNGNAPLQGNIQMFPEGNGFSIVSGGGSFVLDPGQCHAITIRYAPTEQGAVMAELLYGVPSYCGQARTVLVGNGFALQQLSAVSSVGFGTLLCDGDPRDTTIQLRNTGTLPLAITGLQLLGGSQFQLRSQSPSVATPMLLKPGEVYPVQVRYQPAGAGSDSATLQVLSDAPTSPDSIQLHGVRAAVGVASNVNSITFPTTDQSVPKDTVLVLQNSGTVAVTLAEATITGRDSSMFALQSGQSPRAILPGGTAQLTVRLLQFPADTTYRAAVAVRYAPDCGQPPLSIQLSASGSLPQLSATTPLFRELVCNGDSATVGSITLRNNGGATLLIRSHQLLDDPDGAFSISQQFPIEIPPGGQQILAITFHPPGPGSWNARLRLPNNSTDSTMEISLSGRKQQIQFQPATNQLKFGQRQPNVAIDTTIAVTNTGTSVIRWQLPQSDGPFTILSATPNPLLPGQSAIVAVRFHPTSSGTFAGGPRLVEEQCGVAATLQMEGEAAAPTSTTVMLPVASAYVGQQVLLPITVKIDDPAAFHAIAPDSFATTISFSNAILRCDSVIGAQLLNQTRNNATGDITLTIAGSYRNTDTLATILATALLGDRKITPLTFQSFAWNKPNVAADTINGAFAILGDCWEAGLRFVAQPRLVKIVPQPARDQLMIEIEAADWATVRFHLVASDGTIQQQAKPQVLSAGTHRLVLPVSSLPSGAYQLLMETDYGWSAVPVVVAR
ncbi:MAG: choice-of-anchor D domain-containing protein [Armatimonadetes bacterium]|nr:choice-of-anchor D domain-containing protein [Armatimonadota bacterium]